MFLFLLFYSNLVVIAENGNTKSGTLSPGQYEVECRGGQGASLNFGSSIQNAGGIGSKVTAQFKVINTMHYNLNPGKKGTMLNGGYPDGGRGSNSLDYGCGGGSSTASIYNEGLSPTYHFITAAGGSGASKNLPGAQGGRNNTYFKRETNGLQNEMSDPKFLDANGSYQAGWAVEGSGGGGGCMIGKGGNKNVNGFTEIGFSGTSCHSSGNFLSNIEIKSGISDIFLGDGYVKLTYDYLCMPNCIDCDSSSSCNRCDSSHVLYNDGCSLTNCPASYYNNSGRCNECITNCDQCSNGNSCSICKSPYLLYGGKCEVTTCPPSTFQNGSRCDSCITNCEECLDGHICLKCRSPYVKYQDQCENTFCPDSTYLLMGRCFNCSSNCANCNDARTCKQCITPYVLYDGKCQNTECPNLTFLRDGKCFSYINTFRNVNLQKHIKNSIYHISLTKIFVKQFK